MNTPGIEVKSIYCIYYVAMYNFEGMNLVGATLSNAVLYRANFKKAWLTNANFVNAKLSGADFRFAILQGAKFIGAILDDADFRGSDLRGADLRGSHHQIAKFQGAQADLGIPGLRVSACDELHQPYIEGQDEETPDRAAEQSRNDMAHEEPLTEADKTTILEALERHSDVKRINKRFRTVADELKISFGSVKGVYYRNKPDKE